MASYRRVIYAPELCPDACLLFSYTDAGERSFRLRHHSEAGSMEIRPEHCARYVTTSWIQKQIRCAEIARGGSFEIATCWIEQLTAYGAQWIGSSCEQPTLASCHFPGVALARPTVARHRGATVESPFPFLDLELLLASPKGLKTKDLDRMRSSANSEDYVTWALVCAWTRCAPGWWEAVVRLAAEQAPGLDMALFSSSVPSIQPWLRLPTPIAYERSSRARMAASQDPDLVARAMDPRPVEGESEIDLALVSPAFVVFVEAKLGSDISLSTKYDPSRNQLARMIDCLLEYAGERPAAAWMFVRDTSSARLYSAMIADYRRDPRQLQRLLPHRAPDAVAAICSRLALLTWDSLLTTMCVKADAEATEAVLEQVRLRL